MYSTDAACRAQRQVSRGSAGLAVIVLLLSGPCAPDVSPGSGSESRMEEGSRDPRTPAVVVFPEGPVAIRPGDSLPFHAECPGHRHLEWRLQGEGSVAASSSPDVLYRAPVEGERWAILSVRCRGATGEVAEASVRIHVALQHRVRVEASGLAAGFMAGAGEPARFIGLGAGRDCRPGTTCSEIVYQPGAGWAGVYWWPRGCGERGDRVTWERVRSGECALDVADLGGIQTAARAVFWARGAVGGEVVSFQVGGQDILPIPARSTGPLQLDSDWKSYEIDLAGVDLTRVVALFAWIATDVDNPGGATFYLQDIQFVGD